jgi:hypothetical protein
VRTDSDTRPPEDPTGCEEGVTEQGAFVFAGAGVISQLVVTVPKKPFTEIISITLVALAGGPLVVSVPPVRTKYGVAPFGEHPHLQDPSFQDVAHLPVEPLLATEQLLPSFSHLPTSLLGFATEPVFFLAGHCAAIYGVTVAKISIARMYLVVLCPMQSFLRLFQLRKHTVRGPGI